MIHAHNIISSPVVTIAVYLSYFHWLLL